MDRLEAMRVMLAVVDAGSLSAGSRALNAPLSSVSRKLAELERHLGTSLLVRVGRAMQLTDAGRDYVEAARRIIADLDEAERRASGEYQPPRGELTITMPVDFGTRHVMPIALAFMAEHPQITLNLIAAERRINLLEEQVDVAIRLGPLEDSALYALRIGEFRLVTCAAPAYLERHGTPQHPSELVDHDGVLFGRPTRFWSFRDADRDIFAPPQMRVAVNTAAGNVAAALSGAGIARIFDFQLGDALATGALLSILEGYDDELRPIHIVYPRPGLMPLKVRAFIDWTAPRLRAACSDSRGADTTAP